VFGRKKKWSANGMILFWLLHKSLKIDADFLKAKIYGMNYLSAQ
jgi:hypothetical protein